MNAWGALMAAVIGLALIADPLSMGAVLVATAVLVGGAVWLFDRLIGPKPPH